MQRVPFLHGQILPAGTVATEKQSQGIEVRSEQIVEVVVVLALKFAHRVCPTTVPRFILAINRHARIH